MQKWSSMVSISHQLSLSCSSFSLILSVSLSASVSHPICLCLSLCSLSLSHTLSFPFSVSVCLSVCLSVGLSVLESADPDGDNTSNNHFLFTHRKKSLTLGRRSGKVQAAQLGIEPIASGYAHQCSDHWAIMPQPPLRWIIHSSMSTNVSTSL